ncbi:putative glutamine amidotransferase [Kibdelosporangium banguiense]|uniref:Glutamine amidotransferase n=1 Tax=Kibdelosporangium banguiense TaxID=1365924 RepID=A0ABS4TTF7_9PSEU|nr:gamma-glutamyl-gamma-aminobutyrate hydrolase family protein [Kibdelosporangium banguiense]MBP2327682.1 putative glutamine amidotransferase [Kibdelosporangium banguiense]
MRPLIAIPARFAASTSALRYAAEVNARALIESVWRAGGEPASIHPDLTGLETRLSRFDGVLLPGGGDLAPNLYTDQAHDSVYDVDHDQDAFDLAVARRCLESGLPLLAICRGLHVVNVALGGTLDQDIPGHKHVVHPVSLAPDSTATKLTGTDKIAASCYHHQRVATLGQGLTPTAWATDGTIEAFDLPTTKGWFTAVQWHPEDTAAQDPANQALFDALVKASA